MGRSVTGNGFPLQGGAFSRLPRDPISVIFLEGSNGPAFSRLTPLLSEGGRMARAMAVLLVLALGAVAEAQTAPPGFQVDPYGTSLPNGTAMAWSPDGRLFVAQLTGAIRVLKGGTLLPTPFHTVGDV